MMSDRENNRVHKVTQWLVMPLAMLTRNDGSVDQQMKTSRLCCRERRVASKGLGDKPSLHLL